MSRPLENVDARAAAALTHPLRIAILWALEDGPASPSELARRIEAPLEAVSYHVRKLHGVGIIQADEPVVLEGNVRHPYRLTVTPRIDENACRPQGGTRSRTPHCDGRGARLLPR